METDVALAVVQESVADCPVIIDVGVAVKVAVGSAATVPACVTVNVRPAMVRVPVREVAEVLG